MLRQGGNTGRKLKIFASVWLVLLGTAGAVFAADPNLIYELDGTDAADALGFSVAGGGDVNGDGRADFIVGVPFANPNGIINAGSAFIYSGLDGSLLDSVHGTSPGDRVGGSVGLQGDIDGDGRGDYIVGAPGVNNLAGAAYVYSGATGLLMYQINGSSPGERVGGSVGIYGDVDGDGKGDFIVGAPGTNDSTGAAYVYSGATGLLIYQKIGASPGDRVGGSVGIYGDVNADTHADFIVGAPGVNSLAGAAYVYSGLDGSLLYQKNGSNPGDRVGGSVGLYGDVNGDSHADFIVGAPDADPGGLTDAGSAFVYSGLDGSLLFQKNGGAAGDRVGGSVGIQGDVNADGKSDFVIGAPNANNLAGSALVYSGANGTLLYQKTGVLGDRVGGSVGIMGDATADGFAEFIVGAVEGQQGGVSIGLAYVYSGANGNLLYQRNGISGGEQFGNSVAGAGDVNGDGISDFIIGASAANRGGLLFAGSAFVYSGADGSLLFQKNGAAVGDRLGQSVASAGDVNGDGKDDFIIGATFADPAGPNSGSAFVYSGADGSLLFQKDGAFQFDNLGISVASAGDVNGDGRADFIIGAHQANPGGLGDAGSAYVYSGATGVLLYQKDGVATGDRLGVSVASARDVNGDGKADFIIGADRASPGGLSGAGSAFVYSGADGSLLFQKNGAAADDRLGISVASAGGVNGDGKADFIIGAFGADPGGFSNAGSAYVYSGADGSLLFQKDGTAAGDVLGAYVAGAEDVNGDGRSDFIIGAPLADPGGLSFAGSAYVYSGATGSLLFQKDGSAVEDFLGSVASAGDVNGDGRADIIIGALFADQGELVDIGSAFVYTFPCAAVKGDMNADSVLTASDVVLMLNCSFLGIGLCGNCFADVNCDGILSASDVVLELNKVFLGTPFPCL